MTAILINDKRDVRRVDLPADAFELLKQLPTDEGWQVFVDPLTLMSGSAGSTDEALERLYALASAMLHVSDVNPLTFGLTMLDKRTQEEQHVSAVTIMTQARISIDAVSEQQQEKH